MKDVPGFVANRMLHGLLIEANRFLQEEVATAEDIDMACKLGLRHLIGFFAFVDLTDNSVALPVQEILYGAYGERFRPGPILRQKVHANHLGCKRGRGYLNTMNSRKGG